MGISEKSLGNTIYTKILDKILMDEYPAGSRLVNRKIARDFGVSITPVREALSNLFRAGIIDLIPRAGYFVKSFSVQDVMKIYEVRECIEPFTARLAAGKITPSGARKLRVILDELKSSAGNGENAAVRMNKDIQFHATIAEIGDNELLAQTLKNSQVISAASQQSTLAEKYMTGQEYAEYREMLRTSSNHEMILEAIVAWNEDEAERLMREHVVRGKERLIELFRRSGAVGTDSIEACYKKLYY